MTRELVGQTVTFTLNPGSGVPSYLQIVQQIEQALRMGHLQPGDQLPTVKQVVAEVAINPNTVLKAYRELEYEGLATGRRGVGTFVTKSLVDTSFAAQGPLRHDLERWLAKARRMGLDEDSIRALFEDTFQVLMTEDVA